MEEQKPIRGRRPPAPPETDASLSLNGRLLLDGVREAVRSTADPHERLRLVVRRLSAAIPKYTWTGIYLLEGETLVLHNQVGRPTPHQRIPVAQGICGLAVRERRTVVVPDVGKDPRYLACSHETRSEIVVPIFRDGKVVGEIDVDSDLPDAFDQEDRRLLEETARLLGAGS
jgi:GAF domain-containing protein